MKKVLDMLFLNKCRVDTDIFRNLYYSSDISSFAGFDLKLLCENKNYDDYRILKDISDKIGENHIEYKAFIELSDKKYFIRILKDNDSYVYDILLYIISNDADYNLYNKVFFPNKIIIPAEIENINKTILYVNNHVNIIKNEGLFSNYLGYQDWDYKNKCQNMLDISAVDDIIHCFNKKNFSGIFKFRKNNEDIISLKISFIYYNGFYYIDEVREEL